MSVLRERRGYLKRLKLRKELGQENRRLPHWGVGDQVTQGSHLNHVCTGPLCALAQLKGASEQPGRPSG